MQEETVGIRHGGKQFRVSCLFQPGEGKPIVLLPGLGCPKESFLPAFEQFRRLGLKNPLLAIDPLGVGKSEAPKGFGYSLPAQAAIISKVVGHFSADAAHVIGHSMGGVTAGILALNHGEKVFSVIDAEGRVNWIEELLPPPRSNKARSERLSARVRMLRALPGGKNAPWEKYAGWLEKMDPTAYCNSEFQLRKTLREGRTDMLRQVHAKTGRLFYLFGELSDHKLLDAASVKQTGVPFSEIPKAGHFVILDNEKAFYESVARKIREFEQAA